MKLDTLAVHAGYETDPTTKSVAVPIYQTVSYEFDDAQHGADLFNLEVEGNIYSRIMNPTVGVLEERIAALEGGVAALCVSAGSAAINYAILNIAEVPIFPKKNECYIFPGSLVHTVYPFQSDCERVSVSGNFRFSDKKV